MSLPAPVRAPGPRHARPREDAWSRWRRQPERWLPGAVTLAVIVGVIAVTLSQLHPSLLLSNTTTTGGDTGAHVMMPPYLRTLLGQGQLTGWDPAWYAGYPIYTFYFVLPDLLAALASSVIPANIAFKLVTVLGSVTLPVAAWAFGRLLRLRPPIPAVLAAATLPFLFDYSFTIDGGNLFSTLAGEYAYSLGISLALVFLGLFARCLRTGRGRGWTALVLGACILTHILPALFALVGAVLLTVMALLPTTLLDGDGEWPYARGDLVAPVPSRRRTLWLAVSSVAVGVALSGWWLVPFGLRQPYATSMSYANVTTYAGTLFPTADWWVLAIAAAGLVVALARRSRVGIFLGVMGGLSALAVVFDPQASLYNVRFLPLWFLCVYLLAGWAFATLAVAVAVAWQDRRRLGVPRAVDAETGAEERGAEEPGVGEGGATAPGRSRPRWSPGAVAGPLAALLGVFFVVLPPFVVPASALPVTVGANQVSAWAQWNYSGYQDKPAYPEYHGLVQTMADVGRRYGCGRAMWEYDASLNRFGTPESLMLLPYWTNRCIDSMEGLLFESSATTPYHFLNQAELSVSPSDPMRGLPYGTLNVPLGVQHLQLLGVRYFMASSPQVQAEANADPSLKLIASSGPWHSPYGSQVLTTTWDIYLVKDAPLVSGLSFLPAVLQGVSPEQSSWLRPSASWYEDPAAWGVELAQSGPADWPRVTRVAGSPPAGSGSGTAKELTLSELAFPETPATSQSHAAPPITDSAPTYLKIPVVRVPEATVSDIHQSDQTISFHVDRVGSPVLVRTSYFPNWQASGATGPWRVTPNLMVVVPTSHNVVLTYGTTTANRIGLVLSAVGLVILVAGAGVVLWRRRRRPSPGPTEAS